MEPITTLEAALKLINEYEGAPEGFSLSISDTLMDSVGVNMAIITDRILAKGWQPAEFKQEVGFRTFQYESLD